MRRFSLCLFIVFLVFSSFPVVSQDEESESPPLVLSISMYIVVDDADDPNTRLSSQRTVDDLEDFLDSMNETWAQANIVFEPQFVGVLELAEDVIKDIQAVDFTSFFEGIDESFEVPNRSLISAFYVKRMGRLNGISFPEIVPSYLFVSDAPSVSDKSVGKHVSSHEVGHILGLHHDLANESQLMYNGSLGTLLSEEEIIVTRYIAKGILDGLRTSH